MSKNNKKQVAKISIFITSIFVIFLSISYAFINTTLSGTRKQSIVAGNLVIELEEDKELKLENALPMYDEVGIIAEPFNFKVVNPSKYDIQYTLYLEDTTESNKDKLSYDDVKYHLTRNNEKYEPMLLSSIIDNKIDVGICKPYSTVYYQLRLWIREGVEDEETISTKSLKFKINLEAINRIENKYKLVYDGDENQQIEIEANSSKKVGVSLESLNDYTTKYELYYKVIEPIQEMEMLDAGYLEIDENTSYGTIKKGEIKNIELVFNNPESQPVTVEIGVKGELNQSAIVLEKDEYSLKKQNMQKHYVFEYSGTMQKFQIPKSGIYKIDLWGAGGRSGMGAYTSGKINLAEGEELIITVGGQGSDGDETLGGYNGGGNSGTYSGAIGNAGNGATDIRLKGDMWNDFESLKSRVMVAGGGCGGSGDASVGHAGGLTGYGSWAQQYSNYRSYGATQVAGGVAGKPFGSAGNSTGGTFGIGGNGGRASHQGYGGGGGGGYYGGGGGSGAAVGGWGGGGGSSFISGHDGCNAISEESTQTSIIHTNQPNHYSGKVFTDTVMIDGAGYKWTTTKGEKTDMPTHDLTSTMVGNTGNGYARITYIGE